MNTISENKNVKPLAIANQLVVQELKDETLIYNLQTNRAVCLNQTSAFVWNRCDGQTSVAEISRQLAEKTNQPGDEEIVWLALDQLTEENLIAENQSVVFHFSGVTRREAIKKAGLATLIALPLVSALIAPTAASAASNVSATCADDGDACTDINGCCPDVDCEVGGVRVRAFACAGLVLNPVLQAGICTRVAACVGLPLIT